MRRDDVEHALDTLASAAPEPHGDAASLIACGRRRMLRQRLVVVGVALAVLATAASIGAVASNSDARRTVATPTTITPSAVGHARFIAVASSLEAWKCVSPLQHTIDGGRTWQTVSIPRRGLSYLGNCNAVEGGNFWAAAGTQIVRVRHATDVQVLAFPHLLSDEQLTQPLFIDAEHGWIHTYGNDRTLALYRTNDGGTTWSLASTRQGLGQLSFTDAEHGASRYGNAVTITSDGGKTWQAVPGPKLGSSFKVAAHGESIVLWGGSHIAGSQYRTRFGVSTDRGHTWIRRNGPDGFELANVQNAFDAADASNWVVASGNALRVTDDTGRTWQSRPDLPRAQRVGMIAYPAADTVWLASETGRILRSTDAGRTWTDVTNGAAPATTTTTTPTAPVKAVPAQLTFDSATEGWVCGDHPQHSIDDFNAFGAGTKAVVVPPNASAVNGDYPQQPLCASAPGGNFWMIRASANETLSEIVRVTIRPSGDETSVSPFNTEPFGRVEALDFVDANHGWAIVAYSNARIRSLYTTEDGGVSWSALPGTPIRNALAFQNPTRGWSLSNSNSAKLATTTDGGRTWHDVDVPLPEPSAHDAALSRVFVNGDAVVAYGQISTGNFFTPFFDVSTDGGSSWSLRSGPIDAQPSATLPNGFSAADADHWAFGYANIIWVTDDGGRSWTKQQEFSGLDELWYITRPSATAMFVSGIGDPLTGATVVLGTTDDGANWTTISEWAPPDRSPAVAPFPGGIVGCPTRSLTPPPPGNPPTGLVQAAIENVRTQRHYEPTVGAVYSVSRPRGTYASVFTYNVGSCGKTVTDNAWVVEMQGPIGQGGGGSTAHAQVVLAHYADGWHVFGSYH